MRTRFTNRETTRPTAFLLMLGMFVALALVRAGAEDWPQFLGPTRNGACSGSTLATNWPKDGPAIVWQKTIGHGFSGPVVADGKVILHHRLDDQEVVDCLDAKSGKSVWSFPYPTHYRDDFGFDDGPRGTPAIADGKVFTFGAEGALTCVSFADGKKLWSVDTKREFGARKGFFGLACSPLVEGRAVLVNVSGENGAGIVAFDSATGKVLWKATDEEASYSSPVAATIGGKRLACFFNRAGLVALDPANGKLAWEFPWRPPVNASVNAAAPLVIGDLIFVSTCYDRGAALVRATDTGPKTVWSGDDILSNHYATSVHHQGFLYGIDGRADPGFSPAPSLRCVELRTGKVRWSQGDLIGVVVLAGEQLLVLTDRGELLLARATPDGFKPSARAQILGTTVRAQPALANGFLYARDKSRLVCVDLRRSP